MCSTKNKRSIGTLLAIVFFAFAITLSLATINTDLEPPSVAYAGIPVASVTFDENDNDVEDVGEVTIYGTFDDAWEDAVAKASTSGNNVYVKLFYNVSADSSNSFGSGTGFTFGSIKVPYGKYITLNLNGQTINRELTAPKVNGNVISVNGKLTLIDSDPNNRGTIQGGNNAGGNGGGVYVEYGGEFVMQGGTICNNSATSAGNGGGVYCGGQFTMDGGIIKENLAPDGGGVYAYGTTVTINGGVITGNNATGKGGGICLGQNSSLVMTGGVISGNNAGGNGGGVCVSEYMSINISGDPEIVENASGGTITEGVLSGGTLNNLWLYNGVRIKTATAFTGTVGITTQNAPDVGYSITITNTWDTSYEGDFNSDQNYHVSDASGQVQFGVCIITYYNQGATNEIPYSGSSIADEKKYYAIGGTFYLPTVTREGFTFGGWYTAFDGGTRVTQIDATESGDKIFYAKWVPIEHTLTIQNENVTHVSTICKTDESTVTTMNDQNSYSVKFERQTNYDINSCTVTIGGAPYALTPTNYLHNFFDVSIELDVGEVTGDVVITITGAFKQYWFDEGTRATSFHSVDAENKSITIYNERELGLLAYEMLRQPTPSAIPVGTEKILLGRDLDISGNWLAIPFHDMSFDGQGYYIRNLSVSLSTIGVSEFGLFSHISDTCASVQNLRLSCRLDGTTVGDANVGSLFASTDGATKFSNIFVDTSINAKAGGTITVGGFGGDGLDGTNNAFVTNCAVVGSIFVDENEHDAIIGGLIGNLINKKITNSYFGGTISVQNLGENSYPGTVVGYAEDSEVFCVYAGESTGIETFGRNVSTIASGSITMTASDMISAEDGGLSDRLNGWVKFTVKSSATESYYGWIMNELYGGLPQLGKPYRYGAITTVAGDHGSFAEVPTAYEYDNLDALNPTFAEATPNPGYTFAGWKITAVATGANWLVDTDYVWQEDNCGDITITAQYVIIDYTVTFFDWDGTTVLSTKADYHYGDTIVLPTAPTRLEDASYVYEFKEWGVTAPETVTGNASYTARFTAKPIKVTNGTQPEDEDKIPGEITAEEGFAPETTLVVKVIAVTSVATTLTLPSGKQFEKTYNATLYVNDEIAELSGSVTIKFAKPEGLTAAESYKIIIVEDGVTVEKTATVEEEYLVFTTTALGDFAIVADKIEEPVAPAPSEEGDATADGTVKKKTSLWWLIILLAIINVIELGILEDLRKRKVKDDKNNVKTYSFIGAFPLFATAASGEIAIVLALALTALALAVGVLVSALQYKKIKKARVADCANLHPQYRAKKQNTDGRI